MHCARLLPGSAAFSDQHDPTPGLTDMALQSFTHLGLRVADLRRAEEFYRDLFAVKLAFMVCNLDAYLWTLTQRASSRCTSRTRSAVCA